MRKGVSGIRLGLIPDYTSYAGITKADGEAAERPVLHAGTADRVGQQLQVDARHQKVGRGAAVGGRLAGLPSRPVHLVGARIVGALFHHQAAAGRCHHDGLQLAAHRKLVRGDDHGELPVRGKPRTGAEYQDVADLGSEVDGSRGGHDRGSARQQRGDHAGDQGGPKLAAARLVRVPAIPASSSDAPSRVGAAAAVTHFQQLVGCQFRHVVGQELGIARRWGAGFGFQQAAQVGQGQAQRRPVRQVAHGGTSSFQRVLPPGHSLQIDM